MTVKKIPIFVSIKDDCDLPVPGFRASFSPHATDDYYQVQLPAGVADLVFYVDATRNSSRIDIFGPVSQAHSGALNYQTRMIFTPRQETHLNFQLPHLPDVEADAYDPGIVGPAMPEFEIDDIEPEAANCWLENNENPIIMGQCQIKVRVKGAAAGQRLFAQVHIHGMGEITIRKPLNGGQDVRTCELSVRQSCITQYVALFAEDGSQIDRIRIPGNRRDEVPVEFDLTAAC